MVTKESFDWRRSDRRLFAFAAIMFPIVILIGFGRTYYLKFAFGSPPVPSMLVHLHGLLMTVWIAFFIAQVWLIRIKNPRLHMKMGWFGAALASMMIVVGFLTMVAAVKFGSPSFPPGFNPIQFAVVPFFDLIVFALLFGGAIYYRKRFAEHKRLMLLTVVNFLPPALGRFPLESFQALGPLFFVGVPCLLAIGLVIYDTWRNRKLNVVFLVGALIFVISNPLRMAIGMTDAWAGFATWLTTWAA